MLEHLEETKAEVLGEIGSMGYGIVSKSDENRDATTNEICERRIRLNDRLKRIENIPKLNSKVG
jgi:hypothetical protein